MQLFFLGTGAGTPALNRNVSSIALNLTAQSGSIWLFDCGEGTQHQILRAKTVTPHKIDKVFITHLHGDHVLGLPGLLTSRSMIGNAPPLNVYGPQGIKQLLETVLELTGSFMTFDLQVNEISEGIVFEDRQFRVTARELDHRIQSFGFRIEEHQKVGKLNISKLKELGINSGPILQEIKEGDFVKLPDGQVICCADYREAPVDGKVIVICGDTQPCDNAVLLAENADVLVHEATLDASRREKANERGHSTTVQAAELARKSHVKRLIVTHLSARYKPEDEVQLLHECRAVFNATDIAHDFEVFRID